jgi:hypothetical protein
MKENGKPTFFFLLGWVVPCEFKLRYLPPPYFPSLAKCITDKDSQVR